MYLARYLRQETPLLQYLLESKKEEGSDIKTKSYSKMQWSKFLKVNLQEKKKHEFFKSQLINMSSLKVISAGESGTQADNVDTMQV